MEESKFGLLYEPSIEAEVVLLFGLLMPQLGEFFKELGSGLRLLVDEWTETQQTVLCGLIEERLGWNLSFTAATSYVNMIRKM
jgi:hypothetical protein